MRGETRCSYCHRLGNAPECQGDALAIGWAEHADLGDDGVHILMRGHIKGGIADMHARWGDLMAADLHHLLRLTLLDRDLLPGGKRGIDRLQRSRDIKRDRVR